MIYLVIGTMNHNNIMYFIIVIPGKLRRELYVCVPLLLRSTGADLGIHILNFLALCQCTAVGPQLQKTLSNKGAVSNRTKNSGSVGQKAGSKEMK